MTKMEHDEILKRIAEAAPDVEAVLADIEVLRNAFVETVETASDDTAAVVDDYKAKYDELKAKYITRFFDDKTEEKTEDNTEKVDEDESEKNYDDLFKETEKK